MKFHNTYKFLYLPKTTQNKKVSFNYQNYHIETNLCNTVVFNQNQFKILPINQIWKKTYLIRQEAQIWKIKFDKNYFLQWLAYLHWLSPDETQLVWYLYKFSDEDAKDLEELLNDLNINVWIFSERWFKFFPISKNFQIDFENLTNPSNLSSFLFWLTLSFWKFDIKENKLLTIKINLPNLSELTTQNEKLINLFEKLFLQQLFINYQKTDKSLTITIHDRQILEAISTLLHPITWKLNIPKKEKNKILVEKLKEKFNIDKNLKLKIW